MKQSVKAGKKDNRMIFLDVIGQRDTKRRKHRTKEREKKGIYLANCSATYQLILCHVSNFERFRLSWCIYTTHKSMSILTYVDCRVLIIVLKWLTIMRLITLFCTSIDVELVVTSWKHILEQSGPRCYPKVNGYVACMLLSCWSHFLFVLVRR